MRETVWIVREGDDSPVPLGADGSRSLPRWSSSSQGLGVGSGLRVESMPLDAWCLAELPAARRDGLLIGINWSGSRLVGWSFTRPRSAPLGRSADQSVRTRRRLWLTSPNSLLSRADADRSGLSRSDGAKANLGEQRSGSRFLVTVARSG